MYTSVSISILYLYLGACVCIYIFCPSASPPGCLSHAFMCVQTCNDPEPVSREADRTSPFSPTPPL